MPVYKQLFSIFRHVYSQNWQRVAKNPRPRDALQQKFEKSHGFCGSKCHSQVQATITFGQSHCSSICELQYTPNAISISSTSNIGVRFSRSHWWNKIPDINSNRAREFLIMRLDKLLLLLPQTSTEGTRSIPGCGAHSNRLLKRYG